MSPAQFDGNHDPGPPVQDEAMYGGGQNGDTSLGWGGQGGGETQVGQSHEDSMEEESRPIGIKEDG